MQTAVGGEGIGEYTEPARSIGIPERRWEVGSSTERVCWCDATAELFPFLQASV